MMNLPSLALSCAVVVMAAAPPAMAQDGPLASRQVQQPASEPTPPVASPLLALQRARMDIVWKRRGADRGLDAEVVVREPVLRIAKQKEDPKQDPKARSGEPEPAPGSGEVIREAMPFPVEVDRVALHDMAIVFLDETVPGREILRIHDLQVLVENYSTQRYASGGLPTLITARGRIGKEGHVSLFATVNPWTGELDFAGRAEIVGLRLEELSGFVEEQVDLRTPGGTFAAFLEFSVQNGRLSGGVKPILSGVEIAPGDSGFFDQVKAWFAQLAAEVLSDDVRQREAVAGVVPLSGRIQNPNVAFWDGLASVLANAFVDAIDVGFSNVPP